MKKITYLFFKNSQLVITNLFGLYLILISIFAFDRKDINVIFNYGFWLVLGCFIGFYWAIAAIKYTEEYKKKKTFKILRNDDEINEDEIE